MLSMLLNQTCFVFVSPIATNPTLLIKGRDPWYPFKSIHDVFPLEQQNRVDHCGKLNISQRQIQGT